MKSQASNAMLKGLTSQLMPTVTAMPRHCSATRRKRAEIDLEQHRHDHQPDQHRDRNVDLGHGHAAERWKASGNSWPSTMPATMQSATQRVR